MKKIKKEKIGGIYSNAFPLFSQNDLVCRYGLFAQHGSIAVKWSARWAHVLIHDGLLIAWTTAILSMTVTFFGGNESSSCRSSPVLLGNFSSRPIAISMLLCSSSPLTVNQDRGSDVNSCWPSKQIQLA